METILILVTSPNKELSEKLASALVEKHLAACVNIVPSLTSFYRWEGKVQRDSEELLIIKTATTMIGQVKETVLANHTYDTPEFVVIEPRYVEERYANWVSDSVRA